MNGGCFILIAFGIWFGHAVSGGSYPVEILIVILLFASICEEIASFETK